MPYEVKFRKVDFKDGTSAMVKDLPKMHIFVQHDDNSATNVEPLTREQHAVVVEEQRVEANKSLDNSKKKEHG